MKVIRNPIFPFKGFIAMSLFGFIWTRKAALDPITLNHERIHLKQEKELLYIGFWILYPLEFIYWFILLRDGNKAYRSVRFELEAYANEKDLEYLVNRKPYSWKRMRKPSK
jgi:hypothetical protein